MGDLEPLRHQSAHELCVVVQGIAPTRAKAEEVAVIATRQMLYARLPDVKGTAGGVAFLLDEVLPASPAEQLNTRPRRPLGWKTPAHALAMVLQ